MRTLLHYAVLIFVPANLFGQAQYDAKILDYKGLKFPCSGSVVPKLLIRNEGSESMSGCVVETWKNGVLVNTFDWQLTIPAIQGESRQPVFPAVPAVSPNDELEFKIITVNTVPDQGPDGNEKQVIMSDPYAGTSMDIIEIHVLTDDSPEDLTWEIRDGGGALIASGGPYALANTSYTESVVLGTSNCYAFKGADGGRGAASTASMRIVSNGNTLHTISGFDLGGTATKGIRTGAGVACTQELELALRTDGQPAETNWSIIQQSDGATVCAGTGSYAANTDLVETCCLADGCYRLAVTDQGGDGIVGGGYLLRTAAGSRLIDNSANFHSGPYSAIDGELGFCLPLGTSRPIFSSCDKQDWLPNRFIVAAADPLVSAQYGLTNTTSGYEFWFFDPNGGYSYRRFRSHATSDGYGSGATRACHFKINGWYASVANPHLPTDVLLNVRIRSRIAGVYQEFGPACRFKIDPARAACPLVKLQNDPANTADFSCGVTREFGGASRPANRLVAAPPQITPAVASGQVRYQFRFRSDGQCVVRPPQTSPTLHLNWSNGPALECGEVYHVDVRVSKDGGLTWCTGAVTNDAATNCADAAPWGVVCSVTMASCPELNEVAVLHNTSSSITVFPNPVVEGRFNIAFDAALAHGPLDLELFDATGRLVWSQRMALPEGASMVQVDLGDVRPVGIHHLVLYAGGAVFTRPILLGR